LLESFRQPVLVETYLPGREFTVGIVGTGPRARALGVMEIVFGLAAEGAIYSFANKTQYASRITYQLVGGDLARRAAAISLQAWRTLGCRDAGRVDLRCDAAGELNFLEVNPLAGLDREHSDLPILCSLVGIDYDELIRMIIVSAIERVPDGSQRWRS
jgi:D-alanine-D-alanine ligase